MSIIGWVKQKLKSIRQNFAPTAKRFAKIKPPNPIKAFFVGLGIMVPLYLMYWGIKVFLSANLNTWISLLERFPFISPEYHQVISIALTITITLGIGYGAWALHPVQKIWRKLSPNSTTARKTTRVPRTVRVHLSERIEVMAILTETFKEGGVLKGKITFPNAPLPISGWILIIPMKYVNFENETTGEFMSQLISFGLHPLKDKEGTINAQNKDASHD
jgi:uncharacterized membrane protein